MFLRVLDNIVGTPQPSATNPTFLWIGIRLGSGFGGDGVVSPG